MKQNQLTSKDSGDFRRLENVVEKEKFAWLRVGEALTEIRDRKLYREKYATFEDYCRERWGWSRIRSYQLIDAAETVKSLPENVKHALQNPRQATALSTVPPRKRAAVVAAVVAAGPVTAKAITTAAAPDRIAKDKPKPPTINDKTGLPIPTEIHKHWHRAEAIQGTVSTFASARGMVERAQKESDVIFAEVNFSTLRADIDRAIVMLKVVRPYAVCPTCQGLTFKDCGACHGRGFVSEHFWKRCVPEETKSMRSKIVAELKKKANEHS